jgi:hypothetical protein
MTMQMKGRDVRDQNGAVLTCTVGDCSYNRELVCWAPSIKIGDDHPTCDTFTHLSVKPGPMESIVGSCALTACDFNDSTHCTARGVTVSNHTAHADCITFRL